MIKPSDFTLFWSWKNRVETFQQSIYTAHFYLAKEVPFLLVDGGSKFENLKEMRRFVDLLDRDIRVVETNGNTLYEAWNIALATINTRYGICSSSDTEFIAHGLIDSFRSAIDEGYQYCLVDNHGVFMIDRAIIPKVGLYCQGFSNSAHGDCDYLIRITEAGVKWRCINNVFYKHEDTPETTIARTTSAVPDRLPMQTFENEDWFKKKWSTSWPGWRNYVNQVRKPHPPISISEVTRLLPEVNWNPSLVTKLEKLYV